MYTNVKSLSCTPETNVLLYVNYTPIKTNKIAIFKKKKYICVRYFCFYFINMKTNNLYKLKKKSLSGILVCSDTLSHDDDARKMSFFYYKGKILSV